MFTTAADGNKQPRLNVFQLVWFELYFVWLLPLNLSGMGNFTRKIESPAAMVLQIIEARGLFHLVKVIVHGKSMQ